MVRITFLITLVLVATSNGANEIKNEPEFNYLQLAEKPITVDAISTISDNNDNNWNSKCNQYDCFESLQCEINEERQLLYYVYPPLTFIDNYETILYETKSMITLEYWEILYQVLKSSRLTLDPKRACYFVPSIDLAFLNGANSSLIASLYEKLAYWRFVDGKPGTNHIVISLNPTVNLHRVQASIGQAILVATNHDTWTFRQAFDLSIPLVVADEVSSIEERKVQWKLIFTQYNSINARQKHSINDLKTQMKDDLLILSHACHRKETFHRNSEKDYLTCDEPLSNSTLNQFDKTTCRCSLDGQLDLRFPHLLSAGQFCLIMHIKDFPPPLGDSSHYLLGQAMRYGCVPIVTSDLRLPYEAIVKWSEISILLTNDYSLKSIASLISTIDSLVYQKMRTKAQEVWSNHFRAPSQAANNIMQYYDSFVYPPILLSKTLCNQ